MARNAPHRRIVYVPRWRLFAYRAAGWTVRGNITGAFPVIEWRGPGNPVFLAPFLTGAPAGAVARPLEQHLV